MVFQSPIDQIRLIMQAHPNYVAVVDEHSRLTYQDLWIQSNRIANFLLKQGISQGIPVGIFMQRSADFVIALLGVLKSGAAYIPLDPEYPIGRIQYMMYASDAKYIILNPNLLERISDAENLQTFFLEDMLSASAVDPYVNVADSDNIVILFTSGSTGKPKGVELTYKGYKNNFDNMCTLLELTEQMRVAHLASPCFDISVTEMWMPLLVGATVYIASEKIKKNPWTLADWIKQNQIEVIQFVPSFWRTLIHALEEDNMCFPSLKKVLSIGEPLPSSVIKLWFSIFASPHCKIFNLYGPVETSIEVSYYVIDSQSVLKNSIVPIGRPFRGVQFLILDENGKETTTGILYVGGAQLAKGYLEKEQTEKAFRMFPQGRFYCTGDRVQLLSDGNYQFLGRQDRQIKIRGYRVELGEIENALYTIEHVKMAAVVATGQEEMRLTAFVESKVTLKSDVIKQKLQQLLPPYMLPSEFVFLDAMPLNCNKKIDYARLKDLA